MLSGLKKISNKREVLYTLVLRDLKNQYQNTFLGLLWPLLQFLAMVLVMNAVVQFGLRLNTAAGFSYIVWLVPAQVLWLFFVDAINSGSASLFLYSYLIKSINFSIELIPIIKLLSAMVTHGMFIVVMIFLLLINKISPSIYWLQFFYYVFAAMFLFVGLTWLFSSTAIFFRDIIHIVNTTMGFFMWLTPVFWNVQNSSGWLSYIAYINPITYLTEGYRRTFLYQTPFWVDIWWTIYYWVIVFIIISFGLFVFRKLKSHFADVL